MGQPVIPAALVTAVILDAVSFAAAASLGLAAYEVNPLTRAVVELIGVPGFVALKVALALVAALLCFRVRNNRLRFAAAVVTLIIAVGAVSNFVAIEQIGSVL